MIYAGFWRRFGAYWIDLITLLPLMGIYYYFSEYSKLFYLYWFIPSLAIALWFHVYLVVKYGGTPGKLLLKTRIAMTNGLAVTKRAAILRFSILFILSILSNLAMVISCLNMSDEMYFSLGYLARSEKLVELAPFWYSWVMIIMNSWIWGEFITMLFNKKRRAAHDFIAGTVVIRSDIVA